MKLFHTSPTEIKKINKLGRFGEFLFFSGEAYVMTAAKPVVYSIEISEEELIEASHLFYHDDSGKLDSLTSEVMELVGCDEDTAQELISQRDSLWRIDSSVTDIANVDWDIQKITAKAAKILGYRGVEMSDEQGAVWMIDMSCREEELVKES